MTRLLTIGAISYFIVKIETPQASHTHQRSGEYGEPTSSLPSGIPQLLCAWNGNKNCRHTFDGNGVTTESKRASRRSLINELSLCGAGLVYVSCDKSSAQLSIAAYQHQDTIRVLAEMSRTT